MNNIESKQNTTLFTRIIVTYDYHQDTQKKKTKLVEQNNSFKTRSGEVGNRVGIESVISSSDLFLSLQTHDHTRSLTHSHRITQQISLHRRNIKTNRHKHTQTHVLALWKQKWELVDIRKTLANSVFMQTEPKGKLFSKSSIFSACWPKEETRNSSICNVLEAVRRKKG